jgi:hypothetical protein
MITPVIIPTSHSREPSDVEKANIAALMYSDKGELQDAFRAGARFERDDSCGDFTFGDFMGVIFALWVVANILVFFFGFLDAYSFSGYREARYTKMVYVFPGYIPGYHVGKFLGQPLEEK